MFIFPSVIYAIIEDAKYRRELERADLARLQAMPLEQAQIELMHRQTLALERQASKPTVINVKSSIF